jgi:hypothetical protein
MPSVLRKNEESCDASVADCGGKTKKEFDEQVEIFKGMSFEKLYGILEYGEDDVENWLVDYSIKK